MHETYRSLHLHLSVHIISLCLPLLPQNLLSHSRSALHLILYARGNSINHHIALGLQITV